MGTTTTNLDLYKPDLGEVGWDNEVNDNFDTIDELVYSSHPSQQYVAVWGDDTNDGRTWSSAKRGVKAAILDLKNDAGTFCGGTVYVAGTDYDPVDSAASLVYWDHDNQTRGLWIAGPNDSNYASPPAGWIALAEPLRIVGVAMNPAGDNTGGSRGPAYIAGGSGTDSTIPGIWISGTSSPISFEGIRSVNLAAPVRLGLDSADGTTGTNTAGVEFRHSYFSANANSVNSRACIELGYVFWLWVEKCTLGAAAYSQAVTGASVTAGTTYSFTVSATSHLAVGDTVIVAGCTPTGYNGNWTVASIPDGTHFTADIGTNPAAFSANGTAVLLMGNRRAAISAGANGTGNAGYLTIRDSVFNRGGFRYEPGDSNTWGNIIMDGVTHEGNFSSVEPPAFHLVPRVSDGALADPASSSGRVRIANVDIADGSWPYGGVRTVGAAGYQTFVSVESSVSTIGPHINIGSELGSASSGGLLGIPLGQERRVHGLTGHQSGGPAAARYANLAPQSTSGWGSATGTATVTTGIADPYGGTNAATLSSASGNRERKIYEVSRTIAVGDWIVAGCWVRAADMWSDATPFGIGFAETDFEFAAGGGKAVLNNELDYPVMGRVEDDDWRWITIACKVASIGTNDVITYMVLLCRENYPIKFAYPVLNHIPAADGLSDADVLEYRDRLVPYSNGALAGEIAPPAGLPVSFGDQHLRFAEKTDSSAPATNSVVVYARDTGGKTELVARFPTGAIQQIAIEP